LTALLSVGFPSLARPSVPLLGRLVTAKTVRRVLIGESTSGITPRKVLNG